MKKIPTKAELLKQAELRGHNTHNEKLILAGFDVSNLIKRINTKASDDYINIRACKKLQAIIEKFVQDATTALEPAPKFVKPELAELKEHFDRK
jgi:hypothetical protein